MRWLVNLRVRRKLWLIALVGVAGFALYLGFNILVVTQNARILEHVRAVSLPLQSKADANQGRLERLQEALRQATGRRDADMLEEADELAKAISATFEEMGRLDPAAAAAAKGLDGLVQGYYGIARPLARAALDNATPDRMEVSRMRSALQAAERGLKEFRETNYRDLTAAIERADAASRRAVLLGSAIGAAMLLFLLLTAALVGRAIVASVEMILAALREMARGEGDLTRRLPSPGRDEFGELVDCFNRFIAKLQEIIREVIAGSQVINASSRSLSEGNAQLSDRTQAQVSALEETAASMEQMNAALRGNADHTRRAREMADDMRRRALEGSQVVRDVTAAMAGIHDSSRRIVEIISVMDELAFQTNILSLNAAVEAAHAGSQGHGFAVVAAEVRALAQRSAQAAREIKELIQDSVQKVDLGRRLVEQSNGSLQQIVESAGGIAGLVTGISSTSEEQARGVEQVNSAVSEIEQAAQRNGELVVQVAEASKLMQDQSRAVYALLQSFRVEQQTQPPQTAEPAVAAGPEATAQGYPALAR